MVLAGDVFLEFAFSKGFGAFKIGNVLKAFFYSTKYSPLKKLKKGL